MAYLLVSTPLSEVNESGSLIITFGDTTQFYVKCYLGTRLPLREFKHLLNPLLTGNQLEATFCGAYIWFSSSFSRILRSFSMKRYSHIH